MSDEQGFEAQLRDWAADVADQIPPWRPEQLAERRRSAGTRWRSAVALAAAAAVVVGVAGWWAADNDDQTLATGTPAGTDVAGAGGRTVEYERVEYWVTNVDLACPGAGLAGNEVSTAPIVFEAFADRAAKLWKNVVTYPNGDTRQVVAKGGAFYPTELYAGGVEPSPPVGCADPAIGVLAAEPGQSNFVSLNPLDEIPTWTDPNGEVAPMVHGYDSAGVRQPEPTADSQGRLCTIWRQATPGFGGQGRAALQQIDWCVEDATGKVLELTWTNGLDGIGVAVTRQTLTDTQPKIVPDEFFATDGLRRVAEAEYPNGAPSAGAGSITVTTVAGGVAGTLPCPAGMNHVVYGRGSTNNGAADDRRAIDTHRRSPPSGARSMARYLPARTAGFRTRRDGDRCHDAERHSERRTRRPVRARPRRRRVRARQRLDVRAERPPVDIADVRLDRCGSERPRPVDTNRAAAAGMLVGDCAEDGARIGRRGRGFG